MTARTRPLPTKPARPVWPWLLLALLLAGLGYWAYRAATQPRNPPVQPGATRRTPAQDWPELKAFGPRPVGSEGHDRAVDWLEAQFTALGYRVTRQALSLQRAFDLGGTLKAGGVELPVRAIPGAAGGEQTAKLVRVPPQATLLALQALPLQTNIALTTCPGPDWAALTENVLSAGAFGLVVIDDCPTRRVQKVAATPFPLVWVEGKHKAQLLALAGQTVTVQSRVEVRPVTGHNLLAARVNAVPEVVFAAHLDSVDGSLGAGDNASGVLSVLAAARQAAGTPLAEQAWFVAFDAGQDGLAGSRAFVRGFAYPLHGTRAMLNLDLVGGGGRPLGAALHPELLPLARALRPDLRVFEDRASGPKLLGKYAPPVGRSDHRPFRELGLRTAFLSRDEDAHGHLLDDPTLHPELVQDAATFAVALARAVIEAGLDVNEPCAIGERGC